MSKKLINIVSAEPISAYCLRLVFDDEVVKDVDFEPFLRHSRHPQIRVYLDPERFARFKVLYGELVWGDYELCFPVIDLYRNTIEHQQLQATA